MTQTNSLQGSSPSDDPQRHSGERAKQPLVCAPTPATMITFPPSLDCELGRFLLSHYGVPYEERPHAIGFCIFPTYHRFSLSDMAFAVALAPLVLPNNNGAAIPSLAEMQAAMQSVNAEFRARPAGRFALRIYEDHREGSP